MKLAWKHKKLLYVPGMISLLLLPLLCFNYFQNNNSFHRNYSMDLSLPSKNPASDNMLPPGAEILTPEKAEAMRRYKTFTISGSEAEEAQKLKLMQSELHKITTSRDTVNGVKIHFDKASRYDSFIRTLDYLAIEQVPVWGLFGDELYALFPVTRKGYDKVPPPRICGGFMCSDLIRDEPSDFSIIKSAVMKDWKIYGAFAALMLINLLSLAKFNANKMLYLKNHSK